MYRKYNQMAVFSVHSVNVYNLEKQVGGYEWRADLRRDWEALHAK